MSEPLEWEIRLRNEVSAAAKTAAVDMSTFQREVLKAQETLILLATNEKAEAAAARESKDAHEGFFGDMLSAELVSHGIESVTEKVTELGMEFLKSTAEAADFEYKATVALTHLTGSGEVAENILQHARAFAQGVGEDLDKVTMTFEHLAATGLRGDNLTAAAAGAKDLASITGRSFDQTSQLFELIGSDRGLGGRAVRQLAQFPPLLNELERHFGFIPGTAKSFEQLSKHLTEAPVKGAAGLHLLEEEIMKIAHEKELGQVGVEFGNSFEGGIQKIKNDWKMVLGDLSKEPAFEDVRKELAKIGDYFSPAKEGGKELKAILHDTMKPILDGIEYVAAHPKVLTDFFHDATEAAKILAETLNIVTKPLQAIGHLALSFHELLDQGDKNAESQHAATQAHQQVEWANQLIAQGLTPAQAEEAVKASSSPIPAKADGGTVQSTGLVTVHEGEEIVPAGVTAGGGGVSGGGHTFNFAVHVEGGGHGVDEQLLVAKMNETLPTALMNALEQMNQMRGGQ